MAYATFEDYLRDNYEGPWSATDLVIRHETKEKKGIVLIERKYPPFGLALPGGMAERMTYDQNAIKEAKEETGLDVILDDPDVPLCVLSAVDQDPRAHISSIAYTGEGSGELKPNPKEDAKRAAVYTLDEIAAKLDNPVYDSTIHTDPSDDVWAFAHHKRILQIYLKKVGYRA